jgi:uncharacterized protein (TIGR03437 family)
MTYGTLVRRFALAAGILALARLGVAQNPALQLSGTSLAFSAFASGPNPPTQAITVTSVTSTAIDFALLVDSGAPATPVPSWLTVTPLLATTPAQIRVTVNPTGLAAGSYSGRIQLTNRQGISLGIIIPVTLQITAGASQFDVTPTEMFFSNSVSAGNVQQGILVRSLGSGSIAPVSVSVVTGYPWLSATVAACTTVCPVSVNAAVSGLSPGAHTGLIHITTAAGSTDVPVSVYAGDHGPFDRLSPSGVFFEAVQGSGLLDSRTISLINNGDSPSTWSANVTAGAAWLSVSPAFSVTAPGTTTTLTVSMNLGSQTPGAYGGMISITSQDPGAVTLYSPVTLEVDPTGTAPTPILSTGGLLFTSPAGTSESVEQMPTLVAASANPINFQAYPQSPSWLSIVPLRGLVSNTPIPLTVSAAALDQSLGFYSGLINIGFGTSSVRTLHVGFAVTAGSVSLCQPQLSNLTETGTPDNFAVHTGAPTPLEVVLVDDCGTAIVNGTVSATFSNGDPGVELTATGNGHYAQTWTPLNPSSALPGGNLSVDFHAFAPPLQPTSTEVIGAVLKDSLPAIASGGVLNNLSPQVGASIAPGSVVEMFGSALAAATGSGTVTNGALSTTVGGVSVTVGGLAAPIFYTSAGQIDLQVPSELQANQQYQVIINNNGVYSRPEPINTAAAQPGIAAFSDGTVIAQDVNYQLINAQNPAHPGDIITLYLTGMGATNPPVPTGTLAPSSPPATTVIPPEVTIGGITANVTFSGLTPGGVGLYQINVQIPSGAPSGELPIVVSQNDVASNTATVAVQ